MRQGCSPVDLLHIFRTPFYKNTSGGAKIRIVEDVLKMSYIFVFRRCLENAFKTYSRRQGKCLQHVLRRIIQLVFSTFLRHTEKTIIYRKICLGHTSEKFLVRVQNFQEWTLWIYRNFSSSFLKHFMKWLDIIVKAGYQKRCCCLSE